MWIKAIQDATGLSDLYMKQNNSEMLINLTLLRP